MANSFIGKFVSELISVFIDKESDAKISNLQNRIDELRKEQETNTKKAKLFSSLQIVNSWFSSIHETKHSLKNFGIFPIPKYGEIPTMLSLQKEREEKEAERIRQFKKSLSTTFDNIRTLIEREDAEHAESVLHNSKDILDKLNDISFYNRYDKLSKEIDSLKKKIERREKEAERIRQFKESLSTVFDNIRTLIEQEDIEHAESVLHKSKGVLDKLNDASLYNRYDKLSKDIDSLKKTIEIREEKERRRREVEQLRIQKEREQERKRKDALLREEERREQLASEVTQKKDDYDKIIQYLKENDVEYFYHFTDEKNLDSIRRNGGLYSWYYCQQNGINIPNPGGSDLSWKLDKRKGLHDYVRLSFCDDHPMAWGKQQEGARLVLLKISIDVAGFKDTQFSNINATDNDVRFGKEFENLKQIDISATKENFISRNSPSFKPHQAECMVKTFIPKEYIINIDNPKYI